MPYDSGWQSATGDGVFCFPGWETVDWVQLYIPNDTPKSPWVDTNDPKRIRFAGGCGLAAGPSPCAGIDPVPTGYADAVEVFYWHWLEFQHEGWVPINNGSALGTANCFVWKLAPGITLWFDVH